MGKESLKEVSIWIIGAYPDGSMVKNLPASAGDARDAGSILGSGRSPGRRNGNPLQHSWSGEAHGQRSLVG